MCRVRTLSGESENMHSSSLVSRSMPGLSTISGAFHTVSPNLSWKRERATT
jgi:hypothetical protein